MIYCSIVALILLLIVITMLNIREVYATDFDFFVIVVCMIGVFFIGYGMGVGL